MQTVPTRLRGSRPLWRCDFMRVELLCLWQLGKSIKCLLFVSPPPGASSDFYPHCLLTSACRVMCHCVTSGVLTRKKIQGTRLFLLSSVHVKNIRISSEFFYFLQKFRRNWNMFYQSRDYQNLNICRIVLRVLQHICERISSDVWDFEINVNLKFNITHQKFHLKLLSCTVNQ